MLGSLEIELGASKRGLGLEQRRQIVGAMVEADAV